MNEDEKFG